MNFNRGRQRDEPEINFIPLIDLLLVVLIFLVVSTTYARFAEVKINLPEGGAPASAISPDPILHIAVTAQGSYQIGPQAVAEGQREALVAALKTAAQGKTNPVLVINADALATHQSVIQVMEAAREAGLVRITFATQAPVNS